MTTLLVDGVDPFVTDRDSNGESQREFASTRVGATNIHSRQYP